MLVFLQVSFFKISIHVWLGRSGKLICSKTIGHTFVLFSIINNVIIFYSIDIFDLILHGRSSTLGYRV